MSQIQMIIKGSGFHTKTYGTVDFLEQVLIVVNDKGVIDKVVCLGDDNYQSILTEAKENNCLVELSDSQYFLPGFIDLHIHAPQWPQAGIALDEPLNVWLDECTFPLESKYSDVAFARKVYTDLVQQLLSNGTTTALYFATVHSESSLELAKISAQLGQRALVGKVVMDDHQMTPAFYRDVSTQQALKDTEQFILDVKKLNETTPQGVYPVVTPRFVPSCTPEGLKGLGDLAKKYDVHVQSHCSEGQWAHDFVIDKYGKRDTEVLESFGLLGRKSVLAHCNFLNESDGEIFKKHHCSVAHCPISNSYFANAVLPVKRLKEQGVNIGLGSDISGGFSPSLYDNIRHAVMVSRMLEDGVDTALSFEHRGVKDSRISVAQALYLATTGGGIALDLPIGLVEEGYSLDLQIIDVNHLSNKIPNFNVFPNKNYLLQKILYLSTKENIRQVYVQGRKVVDKDL